MTKANLKEIMVRAHEIARRCEGDYQARMVLGLRQAGVIIERIRVAARVA